MNIGGATESNPKAHHHRHILYETITIIMMITMAMTITITMTIGVSNAMTTILRTLMTMIATKSPSWTNFTWNTKWILSKQLWDVMVSSSTFYNFCVSLNFWVLGIWQPSPKLQEKDFFFIDWKFWGATDVIFSSRTPTPCTCNCHCDILLLLVHIWLAVDTVCPKNGFYIPYQTGKIKTKHNYWTLREEVCQRLFGQWPFEQTSFRKGASLIQTHIFFNWRQNPPAKLQNQTFD